MTMTTFAMADSAHNPQYQDRNKQKSAAIRLPRRRAAGEVSKRTDGTVEIGSADACLRQYHEGPESNAQRFAAGLRRCRRRRRGTYRRVAIAGIHLSATVGWPMIAIGETGHFSD